MYMWILHLQIQPTVDQNHLKIKCYTVVEVCFAIRPTVIECALNM